MESIFNELNLKKEDYKNPLKLLLKYASNYSWIDSDDWMDFTFTAYLKAEKTFDEKRGVMFSSWFFTVLRSVISTEITKMMNQSKSEVQILDKEDEDDFSGLDMLSVVEDNVNFYDDLSGLCGILSPCAFSIIKLTLSDKTKKFTRDDISDILGIPKNVVRRLFNEIQSVLTIFRSLEHGNEI